MAEKKRWTVVLDIDQCDGQAHAVARLYMRHTDRLVGEATVHLDPADREIPVVGDELAAARALTHLSHRCCRPQPMTPHTHRRDDRVSGSQRPLGATCSASSSAKALSRSDHFARPVSRPDQCGLLTHSDLELDRRDPLLSLPRYLLVAFPLFVALATLLADRRFLLIAWIGGSALLSLPLVALFVNWYVVS